MILLAIETSCDETALSIVVIKKNRIAQIISERVASQIDIHARFGGIIPEVASRAHAEIIPNLLSGILKESAMTLEDIDALAVTTGPGLVGSLLIGITLGKTISMLKNLPIYSINHLDGHLASAYISTKTKITYPAICLVVSGGHTQLILQKNIHSKKLIGQTIDDAAGEALDKIGKMLGLSYPGGPAIEHLAKQFKGKTNLLYPKPLINQQNFNFSFSGLKTAVLYSLPKKLDQKKKTEIAYAAQKAIVDVLIYKTMKATLKYHAKTVIIAGGVAANQTLRNNFLKAVKKERLILIVPEKKYCTDNATMIASAAALFGKPKHWYDVDINI